MFYYLRRVQQLGLKKSINRIESFFERQLWKLHWKCQLTFRPQILCPPKLFHRIKTTQISFFLHHPLLKKELLLLNPFHKQNKHLLTLCKENKTIIFDQIISLNDPQKWQKDLIHNQYISAKNITLSTKTKQTEQGEIRIAWELSRMHHLFWAALMAKEMTDLQDKKIITDFIFQQIVDWQAENPFMKGIHWYNAMEVAIRATNLIFIAHLLETELKEAQLWQKLSTMLHQHKLFIHSHWETSATPNNHYLADLIGYAHLLLFFNHSTKEIKNHLNKTVAAFKIQILSDGWAYEGSTGYHRLDTELLLHLTLLMQWTDHPLKKEVEQLFFQASQRLTILQGPSTDFPSIGDNDNGKLLTGIFIASLPLTESVHHFPDAGISVISQKNLHCIMRHAEYNLKSPTGHYHRDDLSFILSWQGIPLFIDPGSGMYTGNKGLRNQMRSWDAHNTLFCKDELLSDQIENLFQLTKKEWSQQPVIIQDTNQIKIVSKRPLYCTSGFMMRSIIYSENQIQISDQIVSDYQHNVEQTLILGPDIEIIKEEEQKNKWGLFHKNKKIALLITETEWHKESFYTTEHFGKLKECQRLRSATSNALQWIITCHFS